MARWHLLSSNVHHLADITAVIGSTSSSSYCLYRPYTSLRSTAATKASDTDLKVSAMRNVSLKSPNAAYMEDIPLPLHSFLGRVQNAKPGETVEIDTDADTFTWLTKNFDMVTEMYRAKWELIDKKAIVTIPTHTHESLRSELMWAIGMRKDPNELSVASTDLPVYNGIKIPDMSIYDERAHGSSKESALPTMSVEVSYSETRVKLIWDLIRLALGLQGYLRLALGLNVSSPKELIYLEVIACWSEGSGTLEPAEAQKFQHGEVYGRKEDGEWDIVGQLEAAKFKFFRMLPAKDTLDLTFVDCKMAVAWKITEQRQRNIRIPAKALFRETMGADEPLIISGADLWQSCKKSYGMDKVVRKAIVDLDARGVLGKRKFDKPGIDAAEEDLGEEDESPG